MIGKTAHWIAKHPKTVVLAATLLLIPAVIGFIATRVNYDILTYLPKDLDSVKGEQILDETFGIHSRIMDVEGQKLILGGSKHED